MRRFRPASVLRAIATLTTRPRRDSEPAFEAFARLTAVSGPWMIWFGMPQCPTPQRYGEASMRQ
jgi:hypothetical protein